MDIQMDYATVLTLCSSVSFVLILKLLSCLFIHHSRLVDTLQGGGRDIITIYCSIVLLLCFMPHFARAFACFRPFVHSVHMSHCLRLLYCLW